MKWLKKIVLKWVNEDRFSDYGNEVKASRGSSAVQSLTSLSRNDGMSFTVYSANGGHIVEFSMYNRKTDRTENNLHIIRAEDEFADSLAKIVTLEKLRA